MVSWPEFNPNCAVDLYNLAEASEFERLTISLTIYLLYNLVRLQTFILHDLRPSLQTSTAQSGFKTLK